MTQIIWPMFALAALSIFMVFRLGFTRFAAVKARRVHFKYYEAYQGYDEPDDLAISSRHVVNLFETPLIFYVGCILVYITEQTSTALVVLAWLYVLCRFVHSYVHLAANNVMLRLRVFAFSLLVLITLWGVLGVQLANTP